MNGKGDRDRTADRAAYRANYERVFGPRMESLREAAMLLRAQRASADHAFDVLTTRDAVESEMALRAPTRLMSDPHRQHP